MIRAVRAASPALTIAVGLLVSITATAAVTGGASALLVVRAAVLVVLVLAIAAVLGALVVAASGGTSDVRRGRLLDGAAIAAGVWTVAAATTVFLLYLGEAPTMSSPAFGPGLVSFVADIAIGRTWLIAAAAAAVLTALLVAIRSRQGVAALAALSVTAAVPVALQQGLDGAPHGDARTLVSTALVQLVALTVWTGTAALRSSARALRPACFAAAGIATLVASPELAADGSAGACTLGAGIAILLAGVLAIAGAIRSLPRAAQIVEPVLLAAGLGLGIAGSLTRALPAVAARTTPAEILTGSPLPAPVSIATLTTTWQPDPLWIVVAIGLLAAYLRAVRALRSAWPTRRTVAWVAGVVLLAWLTSGGPARYQSLDLGVHLAQHVALLLLVPLLLAGGAPGRLLAAVRPDLASRPVPRPLSGLLLALLVVGVLYGSAALRWSVTDPVGTEVAIGGCLLVGALLVGALLRPGRFRRSAIVSAVVLLMAETAAAAVLGTGSSLLLADWFGALGWGTDALAAQRSGALTTWPVAVVPTAVLLGAAIRAPRATAPLARPEAVTS